jgi:hypothetical protein
MNAKLSCCGNSIEITDFSHSIQDEEGGNPYNCTFNIAVTSYGFSGFADGCEYDCKEWRNFVKQLEAVVLNQAEKAELHEIGYGSRIVFTADGKGHIEISGLIYGEATTHSLQFEFMTDQTYYAEFIRELEAMLIL